MMHFKGSWNRNSFKCSEKLFPVIPQKVPTTGTDLRKERAKKFKVFCFLNQEQKTKIQAQSFTIAQ